MPFTVSHIAAVVPLRRTCLVWPALIVGSMAPDYEYLVRLDPVGRFGHGVAGMFLFSLPAGLVALWLFETFVHNPVLELLPPAVEQRIPLNSFRWGGPLRFLNIACSVQVGIFTHVFWDWLTHRHIAGYPRSLLLRGNAGVPEVVLRHFKLLQHISSVAGALVLLAAFVWWFRKTPAQRPPSPASASRRMAKLLCVFLVAAFAALVRASAVAGFPPPARLQEYFAVVFAVSGMAFFALAILTYGVWKTLSRKN